jgi:hypothetical protein
MNKCAYCGKPLDALVHKCKFCGEVHCSEHLLPESHKCQELRRQSEIKRGEWKSNLSNLIENHNEQHNGIEQIDKKNLKPSSATIIREEIKPKEEKRRKKKNLFKKILRKKNIKNFVIFLISLGILFFAINVLVSLEESSYLKTINHSTDEIALPKFFQNNSCLEIEQHAERQEMEPAKYKKNFCVAICGQQNLEYTKYNCDKENKFHCFCKQLKNE